MKYKAEDFKLVNPTTERKPLVIYLTPEERANIKDNAKALKVSMGVLVKRCLQDAGLFHAKEEEDDDTQSLLDLGR